MQERKLRPQGSYKKCTIFRLRGFLLIGILLCSACSAGVTDTPGTGRASPSSFQAETQLSAAELRRGYTDNELAVAKREIPYRPEPAVGVSKPRQVNVTGLVFLDANGNGRPDWGEKPIIDVSVTDGLNIVRTNSKGMFSFQFEMTKEKHNRFVVATRPTGFEPTNSFFIRIGFAEEKTEYRAEFGLAPDELSERKEFFFINTSDTQFRRPPDMLRIEKDYAQMTAVGGSPAFMTVIGDLTLSGSQYVFDMYDRIRRASKVRVYDVFGGHDGNIHKPLSTLNYELRVGPPYYSWDYGGVHFIQFVSEKEFLRPDAQKRQDAWLQADLRFIPKEMRVIVATHKPLHGKWFDQRKAEGINIICQLAGHNHEVQLGSRAEVPVIISAPARGRDWGAYSRAYCWVHVSPEGVSSDIRIAGQYERLRVYAPGERAVLGPQPLMVLAYDSVRKVVKLECEITSPNGQITRPTLVSQGDWAWHGRFDADETGDWTFKLKATDSTGQVWRRQQKVRVGRLRMSEARFQNTFSGAIAGKGERVVSIGPGTNPYPQWVTHTGSVHVLHANPAVVNGRVYVTVHNLTLGSKANGVLCLDALTGEKLWHSKSPQGVMRGPVVVHEGVVYAVTAESWAAAFDADTGRLIWSRPLRPDYRLGRPLAINQTPPVVTEYGLLVYNWRKSLLLLDHKTGNQIKEFKENLGYKGRNAPTVRDSIMYFARRGGVYAVAMADGKRVWQQTEKSRGTSTGVIVGGKLIYMSSQGCRALDLVTGEVLWTGSASNNGYIMATPTVWNDLVLVNGKDFRALDIETGQVKWRVPCGTDADRFIRSRRQALGGGSAAVVAGGLAYFGHDDTSVRAVDKNGQVVWEYRLGTPIKTDLAISGNLLFVHDYAGNLWCFAPAAP